MVNAGLGITVMADWIVEPYLRGRNIVAIPLDDIVAKRSWFAATCKQTPAISNFLECLKLYFSGADMNIEENEIFVQENLAIKQRAASPLGVEIGNQKTISNSVLGIKNYQY